MYNKKIKKLQKYINKQILKYKNLYLKKYSNEPINYNSISIDDIQFYKKQYELLFISYNFHNYMNLLSEYENSILNLNSLYQNN